MTKILNFIGVDVSKKTLDIAFPKSNGKFKYLKIENSLTAFKSLIKEIDIDNFCFVMEASGPYYLPFAYFLSSKNIKVCVVNPLQIKHFSKVRMSRAKTDKKDAALISQYGFSEVPPFWKPKNSELINYSQLSTYVELLKAEKTRYTNQLEAFVASGLLDKSLKNKLTRKIKSLKNEIKEVEQKMESLINKNYNSLHQRLQTIPGIGKMTSMQLIYISDGFTKFDNVKQLVSYVGISPRIYESGTSVKGKSRICKMGMSKLRRLLYLCAMTAIKKNKYCKEMYDKMKERGKNGRLAIIAVAHKLLRQAFAIGKNGMNYSENLT